LVFVVSSSWAISGLILLIQKINARNKII